MFGRIVKRKIGKHVSGRKLMGLLKRDNIEILLKEN